MGINPMAGLSELIADRDDLKRRAEAALAIRDEAHSRAPECVCLGCEMARVLRGEPTRKGQP